MGKKNDKTLLELIIQDVPFVSQAPTGNWKDPRQQDGCEEAVSYMAMLWVKGEQPPVDNTSVEQKLLAISDWEKEKFGSYRDTSAQDTAGRIIKDYFGLEDSDVKYDVTVGDIVAELVKGNIVIVPADGRKLGNPYFTAPGPVRHMLVVRGYDPKTDEFITNDNGTKRGEAYRYKSSVLLGAIRDYPTGEDIPITQIRRAMIVVKPL